MVEVTSRSGGAPTLPRKHRLGDGNAGNSRAAHHRADHGDRDFSFRALIARSVGNHRRQTKAKGEKNNVDTFDRIRVWSNRACGDPFGSGLADLGPSIPD